MADDLGIPPAIVELLRASIKKRGLSQEVADRILRAVISEPEDVLDDKIRAILESAS